METSSTKAAKHLLQSAHIDAAIHDSADYYPGPCPVPAPTLKSPCGFLDLPIELRFMIYELVLEVNTRPHVIRQKQSNDAPMRVIVKSIKSCAIVATSRQIYHEAFDIMTKNFTKILSQPIQIVTDFTEYLPETYPIISLLLFYYQSVLKQPGLSFSEFYKTFGNEDEVSEEDRGDHLLYWTVDKYILLSFSNELCCIHEDEFWKAASFMKKAIRQMEYQVEAMWAEGTSILHIALLDIPEGEALEYRVIPDMKLAAQLFGDIIEDTPHNPAVIGLRIVRHMQSPGFDHDKNPMADLLDSSEGFYISGKDISEPEWLSEWCPPSEIA